MKSLQLIALVLLLAGCHKAPEPAADVLMNAQSATPESLEALRRFDSWYATVPPERRCIGSSAEAQKVTYLRVAAMLEGLPQHDFNLMADAALGTLCGSPVVVQMMQERVAGM